MFLPVSLCLQEVSMSFAAGAFSSGLRSGGGGDGGPRRLFSRIKDDEGKGKDGKGGGGQMASGPSPITAQLMFQAMSSMSPGGASSGSANREHAKDSEQQESIKKIHDNEHG